MKYIRLPYTVEAVKFDGTNVDELIAIDPIINQSEAGIGFWHSDGYYVPIQPGMWVVKEDGYHCVMDDDDHFYSKYGEK